ncbi:malonyl-[acyl-carrier protein] O-methyltransferase BioC [Marinobacter maroccanus]|uniref:Malonyl-[acyl-carrier protein] O-methyltransferase n=1 Tax=Marinobacter maroccanus TaxID=2055143 RepID=A0A2S5ZF49_9GAMM|nr:malonyl-ACP O-methyltransferase BioC [Marinobacter maroccanus]PPI85928.1 malonyl-[acyl-carrier protein] O-methyltransferase BioC [Marinobacter maroccanus]
MGVLSCPPGTSVGVSESLKSDIARGFGTASGTYESASRLQRFMGNTMLQKLQYREGQPFDSTVLDLGCGTGWFTRKFADSGRIGTLAGVDLSPGMLERARENGPGDIDWIVGDAEQLPFLDDSVDLIFSNLMIQWCDDPRAVLRECQRILRPGGFLMVSTLLDGTLRELKAAWHAADPDHQHVNRFETELALQAKVHAELSEAIVESRTIRLPYESPMALAGELRHLGAGFRGAGRRTAVTAPGRVRAMCRQYPKEPDGTIMASYEAAWIYWQKP